MVDFFVEVRKISKKFGHQQVLLDVDLTVSCGKCIGIWGRNGSGKSVLLRCILGLLYPETGEVIVGNQAIGKDVEFAPDVGFIIDRPGFISSFSGYQNLSYLARLKGNVDNEAVQKAMACVGLDYKSRKSVSKYSTGMIQRLGIAQAIMESPSLLLLDEPFNGLDEQGVKDMRSLLLGQKARGVTIILTTHTKEDMRVLCDEVYYLDGEKLKRNLCEV